jgi:hypothetical protein
MTPDLRSRRARYATLLRLVRLGLVCLLPTPALLHAQASATPPAPPRAAPEDVASVDAILEAVYDVISGPAGERRDWDRFRSLFVPGARLMPTGGSAGQGYRHAVWTPSEYAAQAGAILERDGFFETEIHRVEERYGPVVHAFSTYESRRTEADAEPFARGINSFQLFFDGMRWWVMSIFWYGETEETPIPERYLPG